MYQMYPLKLPQKNKFGNLNKSFSSHLLKPQPRLHLSNPFRNSIDIQPPIPTKFPKIQLRSLTVSKKRPTLSTCTWIHIGAKSFNSMGFPRQKGLSSHHQLLFSSGKMLVLEEDLKFWMRKNSSKIGKNTQTLFFWHVSSNGYTFVVYYLNQIP